MNEQPSLRFCPTCGKETAAFLCPHDQSRTFVKPSADKCSQVFSPGDVVSGRYRISRLIGKGGFAEVYAGEHTGTLQPVALKVMLPQALSDEVNVRRFFREAQTTARLKHENTVRVIDVDQDEHGYPFLAMELLEGKTLEAWLHAEAEASRWPDEKTAAHIGGEILASLEEAHAHNLVHRDLKPANIMLLNSAEGSFRIKVLDFGAARVASTGITTRSSLLGTPDYMSPEQCRSSDVDGRSDIYALGAILYRCVAGEPPFKGPDGISVMYQHANQLPRGLRETARTPVSPAFADVVMKALAKEPRDRFQSATEMDTALRKSTGIAARAATVPPATPATITKTDVIESHARPSLVPVVALSAVGLALVIGAGVILFGEKPTSPESPQPPKPPITAEPTPPRPPLPPNPPQSDTPDPVVSADKPVAAQGSGVKKTRGKRPIEKTTAATAESPPQGTAASGTQADEAKPIKKKPLDPRDPWREPSSSSVTKGNESR